ncbi:MAG: tetratricopeptide repeat protein, partial [Chitinophagia bacterium]|nr:tetratricopeptide repeat protein [Chitinophagia bacterium]
MNSQAELLIANDLYKQGKNLEALSLLDDVRGQYQNDYKYFILRGLVEAAQNEHEISVKSFVEAIKLEPLDPMAYANIGDALAKNLQHDEAEKYFKLALQLDPDFMEAICGLGVVAFQRCDYEACEAHFLRALELRPNHEIVLTNIGNCYSVQGKYKEALKSLDKAISLDPKNSLARTNRALIRLGAGKFEKGWADYEYRWDSGNFLANRFQDIPRWPGPTGEAANVLIWA